MNINLKKGKSSDITSFKSLLEESVITNKKNKRVLSRNIMCNGSHKDLGHPTVYLKIGKENEITCTYCGQKFEYIEMENKK